MHLTTWLSAFAVRRFHQFLGAPPRKHKRRQISRQPEPLERRTLLTGFSEAGTVLTIDILAGETVSIVSAGTSYSLTSSSTWSGTNSANVTGNGTSTLTVTTAGLAAFNSVSIGDSGANASVNFNNSGANSYSDSISVDLNEPAAGTITFNGATSFVSANSLVANSARHIQVNPAASISVVDGGMSLSANTAGTLAAGTRGITVDNATLTTSGIGNISLTGHGGNQAGTNAHYGVEIINSSIVQTTSATLLANQGKITIDGTGGSGAGFNHGVLVAFSARVRSTGNGAVNVIGQGGAGTGEVNSGVVVSAGVIEATTSGSVTVNGTGGSGTEFNVGVFIDGAGALIATSTGATDITGQGGNGSAGFNAGVLVRLGAAIAPTGTGSVTVKGTGGAGTDSNFGVWVFTTGSTIAALGGDISITGIGGNGTTTDNIGIEIWTGTVTNIGSGKITLHGTGVSGTGFGRGVHLKDTSTVSVVDGALSVTGVGGSGTGTTNTGVLLQAVSILKATGTGSVTVNGTGGAGNATNHGVWVLDTGSFIQSKTGEIKVTGQAGSGGTNNAGVLVSGGGKILPTGSANVTIDGKGGAGTDSNFGVWVDGTGSLIATTTGDIDITGRGGDGTSFNAGVIARLGGAIAPTSTGSITIKGTGGAGTESNFGVWVFTAGSTIAALGGDISITGIGGNGTTTDNNGIEIWTGTVTNIGSGKITLDGTGVSGTGFGRGVHLKDTSTVSVVDGALSVTGVGGSGTGTSNAGVFLQTVSVLKASGTGTVTIEGTGGTAAGSNIGVVIADPGTLIETTTGEIKVTGEAGDGGTGNIGVYIGNGAQLLPTGAAKITINGTGGTGVKQNIGVWIIGTNTKVKSANDITIIGSAGDGTQDANEGVIIDIFAVVETTGSAKITIDGEGGAGTSDNHGVNVIGQSTVKSDAGLIEIDGAGGGSANRNMGVAIIAAGLITSVSGTISIEGTGGTGGTDSNYGVWLVNPGSNIISTSGDIEVTGQGGSGSSTSHIGIGLQGGSIQTQGNGKITLVGTGGVGSSDNYGIHDANGSTVSAVNGEISITGVGGTAAAGSNFGVAIWVATVVTTGTGGISIDGKGAGTGFDVAVWIAFAGTSIQTASGDISIKGHDSIGAGVLIHSDAVVESLGAGEIELLGNAGAYDNWILGGKIRSKDGDINITGTNGAFGLLTQGGGSIATTTAGTANITIRAITPPGVSSLIDISNDGSGFSVDTSPGTGVVKLIADNINIGAGTTINVGPRAVTVLQEHTTTSVNLGGSDAPNVLGLTDDELDRITAGTLVIGDTNTNGIAFAGSITRSASTKVLLTTKPSTDIAFGTGSLNAGSGGDVTLTTSGSGGITTGDNSGTDITGDDITLNAGSGGIGTNVNFVRLAGTTVIAGTTSNAGINLAEADNITIAAGGLNSGSGTVALDGGTFKLSGNELIPNAASLFVNSGAVFDLQGQSETINGLNGAGSLDSSVGSSLLTVGSNDAGGSFSGLIQDTGVALGLTKVGTGTLILTNAANTYSGITNVNAGTLVVNGANTGTGAVNVNNTATLGGSGTIAGPVTIGATAHLAPGNSPGVLNTGDLNEAGVFNVEIAGNDGPGAANGHDMVNVTGTVTIDDTTATLVLDTTGWSPAEMAAAIVTNVEFVLINNNLGDAVTGFFLGLPEGTVVATNVGGTGIDLIITYVGDSLTLGSTTGNDVVLRRAQSPTLLAALDGSGNLEVTDLAGKVNVLTASRIGAYLVFSDAVEAFFSPISGAILSNGGKTISIPVSALAPAGHITVFGAGNIDSLSVDRSTDLGFDLDFDGGAGALDQLILPASSVSSVTHEFTAADGGSVTVAGLTHILTYGTVELVTDNLAAADRAFTNTFDTDFSLTDTAGAFTRLDPGGRKVDFANPTNSLEFSSPGGTISLFSFDAAFAASNLILNDTDPADLIFETKASEVIPNGTSVTLSDHSVLRLNAAAETINGLTGTGHVETAAGSATLTVGANGASSTFDGTLEDGGGILNFTKAGAGTVILTSSGNTYMGTTNVNGGILRVNGSLTGGGAVNVNNSATLGGSGSISGPVTVGPTAHLAPGNSPGMINTGDFTENGILNIELAGDGGAGNANGHDQVNVTGTVTLNAATATLSLDTTGLLLSEFANGSEFTIINNNLLDPVTGTFNGLAEGATVIPNLAGSAFDLIITYNGDSAVLGSVTGNDVVLRCVPALLPAQPPVYYVYAGGNLNVYGTGHVDDITVQFSGTNAVTLIGNGITSFFGAFGSGQTVGPFLVTGNIDMSLGNNDDRVLLLGTGLGTTFDGGNVSIDLGSGHDILTTTDVSAPLTPTAGLILVGGLSVLGGSGNDAISLGGLAVADTFRANAINIDTGSGGVQSVSLDRTSVGTDVTIKNGGTTGLQTVALGVNGPNSIGRNLIITQADGATGYAVGIHETNVGGFVNVTNGSGSGAAVVIIDTTTATARTIGGSTTITNGNNVTNAVSLVGTLGALKLTGNVTVKNGSGSTSNDITVTDLLDSGTTASTFTNGIGPDNSIVFNGALRNTFLGTVSATNGPSTGTNVITASRLSSTRGINLINGTATTSNDLTLGGAAGTDLSPSRATWCLPTERHLTLMSTSTI